VLARRPRLCEKSTKYTHSNMLLPTKDDIETWVIIIVLGNLPFYTLMPQYKPAQWCELAYNTAATFTMFYISANCMLKYYNGTSPYRRKRMGRLRKWGHYLSNKHILLMLALVAVYVALSILVDSLFFGRTYPLVQLHIYRRLYLILLFVVGGMYHARNQWKEKKMEAVTTTVKEQNKVLRQSLSNIKELYNKLKRG
jgi:hypothetical protein